MEWQKVVFADECPKCELCDEPFCRLHNKHYADCDCIGPMEDGTEYITRDGVLYGRRVDST